MRSIYLLVIFVLFTPFLHAQQTGGVFGPVVNEGAELWQYRATFNPETDGFAQRLHFQRAINDDFMWRVLGQTVRNESSDFDFDFLGAELFWELGNNDPKWRRGVRFDIQLRDDNRPQTFGAHWIHQFALGNGWGARAILFTTTQFGDNAADGIGIQLRGSVTKQLPKRQSVGVEWFSNYGTTSNFASADEQNQVIGPRYTFPVSDKWNGYIGALFGINDVSPDAEIRLWFTHAI